MGKNNLILGTGRGKLGDIVFYRTGGEQRFRTRVRPTNPRSNAQLLQRCVVSTAVKFYSVFVDVLDHAFQNYNGRLKNHQRFMKLNIDILRKVALQNVYSWSPLIFDNENFGNWTAKDSSDIAINNYQVSEGDLINNINAGFLQMGENPEYTTYPVIGNLTKEKVLDFTYQEMCNFLQVNAGDQLTFLFVGSEYESGYINNAYYARVIMMPNDGDMTSKFFGSNGFINKPNKENNGEIAFVEATENNENIALTVAPSGSTMGRANVSGFAVIQSRLEGNQWKRSSAFMRVKNASNSVESLEKAMLSYKMQKTSSKYLDQADSESNEKLFNTYENEVIVNEEIEKKTTKKK